MKGDLRNGVYVGLVVMLYACMVVMQLEAALETKTCFQRKSPCFLKKQTCPKQCPSFSPPNGSTKACVIDCFNPICKATCRSKVPILFLFHNKCRFKILFLFIKCRFISNREFSN